MLAVALTILFADICDRSEISKTRRRANLLKRKVLSAGNIVQGKQGPGDRGEYTTHQQNMASASTRLSDIVISDNILDLTPQKFGVWPNIVLISDANMMTTE